MDYSKLSKEELIRLLHSRDEFIQAYKNEKRQSEDLSFAWVGNLGQWYWDVKNNIVDFNPLKATNLGYTKEEIPDNIGFEFFTDKLDPEDYEEVMQNMRDHLYGKAAVYETEYRIKTKDGEWRHYYDRGKITKRDEEGKPLFLAGIVFDITEQKNYEQNQQKLIESLSEQLSLKEQLFSTIFHDLRSPIANIVSFADLLQETAEKSTNPEVRKFARIIMEASKKALGITEDLMEFVRAKKNPQERKKEIKLLDTINKCIEEFRINTEQKRISIINHVNESARVIAPEPILRIAIRNFISNAVKFTNEEGKIQIEYKNQEIIISDNGVGMPEQKLNTLFTGKTKSSRGTADEKGSGIGLLLVKELLDKAKIDLSMNSKLNHGTTIRMRFNQTIA